MFTRAQFDNFLDRGQLTVEGVFSPAEISVALDDFRQWSTEVVETLRPEDAAWYLEQVGEQRLLRKLDHPVHHRAAFYDLAAHQKLLPFVRRLVGENPVVIFSQIFCKPPGGGGPKPVHQDNFYFGVDSPDQVITAWIALDDATLENGCLHYGLGSHRGGLRAHAAPPDRPFDLQVVTDQLVDVTMTPCPVPAGGVSFHHSLTLHQSGHNRSSSPRRALAIHYANAKAQIATPALPYDSDLFVEMPT